MRALTPAGRPDQVDPELGEGLDRVNLPWIVDGAGGVRQPAQCLLCLRGVCCGVLDVGT